MRAAMKQYRIRCQAARLHGAIGVFCKIDLTVWARDEAEAVDIFRSNYETCAPPVTELVE